MNEKVQESYFSSNAWSPVSSKEFVGGIKGLVICSFDTVVPMTR
jgi:hypothetical protein